MNSVEFISSLGKIIVFLMVLFSIFLFTVRSDKKLSNRIFSFFLLVTAFDLTGLFLTDFLTVHLDFTILKISSSLLQMPLFYLYVLSVCYSDFRIKAKHLAHTILFFLFILIFKSTSISEQSLFYYRILGELHYFGYILAVFYALKRYKTLYLENYSNVDYAGYKLLFQITVFFCFAHVLVMLKKATLFLDSGKSNIELFYILISLSALSFICWVVLRALHNPHLFTGIKSELITVESTIKKSDSKPEKDAFILESIERLLIYMKKEKPYLDFEVTLEKLASNIEMPEKDLSILINHHLGKHFFDFVNEYRIDEAKKILENPDDKNLTILEILYRVGFNSKSSFYTAFKKITNDTPTSYRKSALTA